MNDDVLKKKQNRIYSSVLVLFNCISESYGKQIKKMDI